MGDPDEKINNIKIVGNKRKRKRKKGCVNCDVNVPNLESAREEVVGFEREAIGGVEIGQVCES